MFCLTISRQFLFNQYKNLFVKIITKLNISLTDKSPFFGFNVRNQIGYANIFYVWIENFRKGKQH